MIKSSDWRQSNVEVDSLAEVGVVECETHEELGGALGVAYIAHLLLSSN